MFDTISRGLQGVLRRSASSGMMIASTSKQVDERLCFVGVLHFPSTSQKYSLRYCIYNMLNLDKKTSISLLALGPEHSSFAHVESV